MFGIKFWNNTEWYHKSNYSIMFVTNKYCFKGVKFLDRQELLMGHHI